jgi:hypothetical protein
MNAKQFCGVIVALCVAAVAARADSLELKNGSLIRGKFMGGTHQTSISFQGKIYLHVFDGPTGSLSPVALGQKVQSVIP